MNDELMHAVGDDAAWSESYYFNFVDPSTQLGMFTRMGFRPGNGWADALHVVYLGGTRVAFTYGRRDIERDLARYDGDLTAGHLTLDCVRPHDLWQIRYHGPAQSIPDAAVLLERSKRRPDGWFTPAALDMELSFRCLTEPHYADEGARGHFEQSGHVTGSIMLDGAEFRVDGYGVRDKSWGPRDWGAGQSSQAPKRSSGGRPAAFVNWFSMNFGDYAALGGSCFRRADGGMRGAGWLQRDGSSTRLDEVVIETDYQPNTILHRAVTLRATTQGGEQLTVAGRVLNVCPTKIPTPGGATFVNEGLTEFRWGERTGFGIAEHWHLVARDD